MSKDKKDSSLSDNVKTTLGVQTVFNGTIKFKDSLKILGRCEGRIESQGSLSIEPSAEVTADISVGSIVVGGIVRGNIEAFEKVEVLSTGKIYGNICTAKLKMSDGVVFDGKVEMLRNPDMIDVFSTLPSQLKQTLETF